MFFLGWHKTSTRHNVSMAERTNEGELGHMHAVVWTTQVSRCIEPVQHATVQLKRACNHNRAESGITIEPVTWWFAR
jgi:hypothetical protein